MMPLEIVQNYFMLSDYQKAMFSYYRKYKQFESGEEKLLGFF
jgi:hypothetical protein